MSHIQKVIRQRSMDQLRRLPLEYYVLLALAVLFLGLATMSALARVLPVPRLVLKLLDVGTDTNIWTWANVLVLSYAALAHSVSGLTRIISGLPGGFAWLLSACVIAGLSLDDFVQLHERTAPIGKLLGGGTGFTHFAWLIPGSLVGLVCIAGLLPVIIKAEGNSRRFMIFGTVLFFTGAFGLEALSGYVLTHFGHAFLYDLVMHIEELFEAFGAVLFLCAPVADLWCRRHELGRRYSSF